jgi:hypothetical protein
LSYAFKLIIIARAASGFGHTASYANLDQRSMMGGEWNNRIGGGWIDP